MTDEMNELVLQMPKRAEDGSIDLNVVQGQVSDFLVNYHGQKIRITVEVVQTDEATEPKYIRRSKKAPREKTRRGM